ncbi:25036ea9-9d3f-4291-8344-bc571b731511 [Sclerotinia trifoliorum]|uniref:25036ea9-9d3f-4291-8344-bc571b731511 n=1 Tax=Sclerotinia trifoliorum TaxID=28548 RepID=A0A8H2VZI8_9HELO|nr:25036ea9-9d3f-4291-8344-bc571b731511 [Sclerotinia trifoliorum]
MVSFSCENCGDVLTKKKLDPHRNQCRGASYTCLDCMVHFQGLEYRAHTSCMSEAQKYQGALYRGEGKGKKGKQQNTQKNNSHNNSQSTPVHKAYVEDAQDEYDNSQLATASSVPKAPSPPAAVNVFDFLVDPTPNASRLELPVPDQIMNASEPTRYIESEQQVRDESMSDNSDVSEAEEKPSTDLVRVNVAESPLASLVEWGSGPVPTTGPFETPAPKAIEWKPTKEHEGKSKKDKKDEKKDKKDKKRKRLHVDTHDLSSREGDVLMDDAPPVLHSGLTGGLGKLLSRPSVFPPSPDYSGADAEKESPSAKTKKTKESKRASRARTRHDGFGSNFMALITTRQPSREHSEDRPKKRKHKHGNKTSEKPKMLEYKPINGATDTSSGENQMVVYKPRAELLMSMVNKGPNSEKGVSMNKALKRYHRERIAAGLALGKGDEEKELWRSLRMKKNDRGEIVLFM